VEAESDEQEMKRMFIQKRAELGNRRALIFAVLFVTLVSVGIGCASATITVCHSGCDYASIQAAVDAADSGDTIEVHSGTYYENVDVNKMLILKGVDDGSGKPVVDAGGNDSAITLSVGEITLEGFNVTNAGGDFWVPFKIFVLPLSVDGITLEGFNATNAGGGSRVPCKNFVPGVKERSAGITVISNNNIITNNTASNNGVGIHLSSSSNNTFTCNTISNNHWDGIRLNSSCNNTFTGNNVSNNHWDGIRLHFSCNNTITGNNVRNNRIGISLDDSCNNTITGNTFLNDGLSVDESYQNTIKNNTVNGMPLVYLEDKTGIEVTDAGQVILVNCTNITVENLDLSNTYVGVSLFETEESVITSNTVSNHWHGINLDCSNNNTIIGNNASSNEDGIRLHSSSNNTITGNNASNNGCGICLWDSRNNIITGNNASNNWCYGILLFSACNNTFTNNAVSNNDYGGIYLIYSGCNNNIIGNTFVNNGLCVGDSYQNTVENNTVNGKPLVYLVDTSDTEVTDAGQVILVNCRNITVENLDLSNTCVGIELYKTHDSIISNNTVSNNNMYGIILWDSSINTITGNNVSNNGEGGIYLINSCCNNNIIDNTFVNNGLFVGSSYQNTVENNRVNGKPLVYLVDTSDIEVTDAGQVILVNCRNITVEHLDLSNTCFGIELYKTHDSIISNNTVSNNNMRGIRLHFSSNNIITGNNVSNNGEGGIWLWESNNNKFYLNNFINNSLSFGYSSTSNIMNSTEQITYTYNGSTYTNYLGNYWSDYKDKYPDAKETEDCGIWDTPYSMPYRPDSDNYPLMLPWENYLSPTEPYTKTDVGVNSTIIPASPTDLAAYLPPDYNDTDISDSVVLNVNVTDNTPDTTDAAYTDITINVDSMDIATCKVFKTGIGFLPEVEDVTTLPTVSGEPAFSRDVVNKTVTVRLFVGDPLLGVIPAAVEPLGFDTGEGTYPSIMGTHNGTIIPSRDINISKLYTYPCAGTGGHSESIKLYENVTLIANGSWVGYEGDWHNITIDNVTGASYVMLLKNHEYNYTIVTGSYPQIIHEPSKEVTGGTITCSSFVDVNGKVYYDWIPAIRLE